MDLQAAREKRLLQLNELDEFQNDTYENAKIYKEKTKAWHEKHIVKKEFELGQQVLLFNPRLRLFAKKLKSSWSGPFIVRKECSKVNGQSLKPYFGGEFNAHKASIIFKPP